MSPPGRTLEPEAPTTADVTPDAPIPASRNETEEALLGLQESAGNRAVASVLGGRQRVQRAPNDPDQVASKGATTAVGDADDKPVPSRGSVTAVGDADDKPVPSRGSVTAVGDADDKPVPSRQPPGGGPQPGPAPGPGAQAGSGAGGGKLMAGGVPKVQERMWFRAKPVEDDEALVAYSRDPSKVIRSPDRHWHWQMWNKTEGPSRFGKKAPMVMRAGDLYVVHPNYQGPATPLPSYRGQGVGLGTPGGTGGSAPAGPPPAGPTPVPGARLLQDPSQTRLRQAVSPETPVSGPRGSVQAQKATYQEVAAALAKNPGSVVRSPNLGWHKQGFGLDGGEGDAPGAYRVGNLYVIEPNHALKGVPKLGEAVPPKPSALPQAAQLVGLPGTDYAEKTPGRNYTSSMTRTGDRTEIRDRRREISPIHAQVVTGQESEEGDIKRRKESKIGAGFGRGGNLFGAGYGRTDTTKAGDDLSTAKGTQVSLGATKDEKIALTAVRTRELVVGKTPAGDPLKRSSALSGGATYDPKTGTYGANAAYKVTGPGGTTKSVSGGATLDGQGNASVNAGGALESKGGSSISTSLNASTKVVAEEPVEQADGSFLVAYRLEETTGGSVGGGQRLGGAGAPTVGASYGRSTTQLSGGTKAFPSEIEANRWRADAGAKLRGEQTIAQYIPPTTVAGALMIPIGGSRMTGETDATTAGVSGSFMGNTLGHSRTEADTRTLEIRHVSKNVVEVTGSVLGSKTGDTTLSNPVFGNTSGSTQGKMFAVTWSFDLGTDLGGQGFERYCKSGIPIPGGSFKYLDTGSSDEDHDNYKIPYVGTVSWSGTTWESAREDAAGNTQKAFGGKQSHAVNLGLLGHVTGDKERSSNAQIVRTSENGDEKTARAEFKVDGESGSFNRDEFGKIFQDKRPTGEVTASGKWTLSSEVPMARIRDLEKDHPELRNAWNIDEKMRIYSRLVKEGGAQMLRGQVGMLSKSWDLELKGDSNFPGPRERMRLYTLKVNLKAQLKEKPGDAYRIAREAKEVLEKLETRLEAISKPTKYTDLPEGLRQQQKELVQAHIQDFTQVRQSALSVGIAGSGSESYDDVQKRASSKQGYAQLKPGEAELKQLQDGVFLKDKQVNAIFQDVRNSSRALGDVVKKNGDIAARTLTTADERVGFFAAQAATMLRVKDAYALSAKQDDIRKQIELLREDMDKYTDPTERLQRMRPIDKAMSERIVVLKQMLGQIETAGAIIAAYATKNAMSSNKAFWKAVGGDVD